MGLFFETEDSASLMLDVDEEVLTLSVRECAALRLQTRDDFLFGNRLKSPPPSGML
jgi:hypothetical protein